jgi:hypothetical protein
VLELTHDTATLIRIALDDEHLTIVHWKRERRWRFEAGDFHRCCASSAASVPNLHLPVFTAPASGVEQ